MPDSRPERIDARTVLREHAVFICIVAAYFGVTAFLSIIGIVPFSLGVTAYMRASAVMLPVFLLGSLVAMTVRILVVERPEDPAAAILVALHGARIRDRFVLGLPVLLLMPAFASAFTLLKTSILVVSPETVDMALAQVDRAVHGGVDPWRLIHPVLGRPIVTLLINWLYEVWLMAVVAVWFWQAFSLRDRNLRQRFFVSFLLCWVLLGTITAHLLPSAGPCFYGRVTGLPDDFAPLMDYLRTARQTRGVWVTGSQDFLWGVYESNRLTIGAGISAMPSMHVSFAFLFAIVGWKTDRRLGMMLAAYAAVILLGSVHLGWHYAIDGYYAIAATGLIWWGVGWMQRRTRRRRMAADSAGHVASETND